MVVFWEWSWIRYSASTWRANTIWEAEVIESELILNRAGRIGILREEEHEALTICPKRRKHLTTDWPDRKNYICCYPAHQGLKRWLSLPKRVNAKMSAEIFVEFKEIVPIGAGKWRFLLHLVNSFKLTWYLGYGTSDTCGSLHCSFIILYEVQNMYTNGIKNANTIKRSW